MVEPRTPDAAPSIVLAPLLVCLVAGACAPNHGGPLPGDIEVLGSMGQSPGQFKAPRSVAYDASRRILCVVDRSGRIQAFREGERSGPGSDSSSGFSFVTSWLLPEYKIGQPTRIHFDRDGRLLVADTHYSRILTSDVSSGALVDSWGGAGVGDGEFSQVRDVIQDRRGDFYVGDYGGFVDRIHKFDANKNHLATFGSRGERPGEFQRIQGLAIAVSAADRETLLVVDSCNHRVQRLTLEGDFIEAWGSPGTEPGEFNFPYGIAVEDRPGGDVFIVEWGNNRVQRFDANGRYLRSWGRPGRAVGELATPWDIALSGDGRVFVADYNNHRIQIFRLPEPVANNHRIQIFRLPEPVAEASLAPRDRHGDALAAVATSHRRL